MNIYLTQIPTLIPNYYPFGLEHKGYNDVTLQEFNYKQFQGQEYTEDLSLNIHEWKYRVSDPTIGRFWQVDPLAEKYKYQTVYQFSSNQPIHAPELEGLESRYDLTWNEPGLNSINASAAERKQYNETVVETAVKGAPLAIAIATPIPGDEALVGSLLFKTGVAALDATSQMAATGEVDLVSVAANFVSPPAMGPLTKAAADALVDVNVGADGIAVETVVGSTSGESKSAVAVGTDFLIGVAGQKANQIIPSEVTKTEVGKVIVEGITTGAENIGGEVLIQNIENN